MELRETQRGGNSVRWFGGVLRIFAADRLWRSGAAASAVLSLSSPNAIDPVETFTAFLLSVVAGARRFAHTSLLRADAALHALLGISRFPIDDTVRNLFKGFGQGQFDGVAKELNISRPAVIKTLLRQGPDRHYLTKSRIRKLA